MNIEQNELSMKLKSAIDRERLERLYKQEANAAGDHRLPDHDTLRLLAMAGAGGTY